MFRPFSINWMAFSSLPEIPVEKIEGYEVEEYWMDVQFLPDWYHSIYIQWDIPEEWKGLNPIFTVFMSESEGGPYHQINHVPTKDPYYIVTHDECPSLTGNRDFFVIQTTLSNGKVWKSQPLEIGRRLPRWQFKRWAEVIRREWILLDKFAGIETAVFRKKDYGKRCPHCWDESSEKIVVDNCPHCMGVSFEHGYATGIKTKVQYDSSPDNRALTYFGKLEQNQITGWTIAYPTLRPHDILIRLNDRKVFRVEALQNTEMMTTHVRQILQLNELPKSSIEHKLVFREMLDAKIRPRHVHGFGDYSDDSGTVVDHFVETDVDLPVIQGDQDEFLQGGDII